MKNRRQFLTADDKKIAKYKETQQFTEAQKNNLSYGIQPWKTGAALRSRPTLRALPRGG